MKTLSILFVLLLCLVYGCTKPEMCDSNSTDNDPLDSLGLPFATTTGENTFGCLINGEPWRPGHEGLFGGWVYDINFSYGTSDPGTFSCNMYQNSNISESALQFSVYEVFNEGEYGVSSFADISNYTNYDLGCDFDIDLTFEESNVTITRLDEEEEIISGTYNFKCIRANFCEGGEEPDTLWVTEGRFDLKGL